MVPNHPTSRASSASARLRWRVALVSAAILGTLLLAFAAVTVLAGGAPGDMAAPAAGALLAFVTEMLCLNAAIRRVERLDVDDPAGNCPALRRTARA